MITESQLDEMEQRAGRLLLRKNYIIGDLQIEGPDVLAALDDVKRLVWALRGAKIALGRQDV